MWGRLSIEKVKRVKRFHFCDAGHFQNKQNARTKLHLGRDENRKVPFLSDLKQASSPLQKITGQQWTSGAIRLELFHVHHTKSEYFPRTPQRNEAFYKSTSRRNNAWCSLEVKIHNPCIHAMIQTTESSSEKQAKEPISGISTAMPCCPVVSTFIANHRPRATHHCPYRCNIIVELGGYWIKNASSPATEFLHTTKHLISPRRERARGTPRLNEWISIFSPSLLKAFL